MCLLHAKLVFSRLSFKFALHGKWKKCLVGNVVISINMVGSALISLMMMEILLQL